MGTELSKALDECLTRIRQGEAVEACLVEYPDVREQLEPLVYATLTISTIPKASPSDEFRKVSKVRLMARLRAESNKAKAASLSQRTTEPNGLAMIWQRSVHTIAGSRRVAIPIALTLLLALVGVFGPFGVLNSTSTPSALASECTLSILSGSVEVQKPGSTIWELTQDSITLQAGSRVRTAPQSQAVLTFFEGSTLTLEANTDVEIQRVEYTAEQHTDIILKQWLGRTWSRVVKMADPGSRYEIKTPSTYALVRGTLFVTEVDQAGSTTVLTIEGLVAVGAQNEEVDVPAGYGTEVELGAAPSVPIPVELPAQGPPGQDEDGPPGHGPDDEGPPGQDEDGPPGHGPDDEGPPEQDEDDD